jgi:DNA-binding response OmpR family regulator
MAKEKIAIVEDEADIREVMAHNLKREGYRVLECGDGGQALDLIRRESPAIVLLDLMLPGKDGMEVCRLLKQDPLTRAIPVVMVTAKGEEADVVAGLSVGADDYIKKPFSMKELLARVRTVLRRGPSSEEASATGRIVRGDLAIEPDKFGVTVGVRAVTLTPTEFRLLLLLASNPGRVFTRDQLLNRVIGESAVVTDRNIDVHIRSLRKKLGGKKEYIDTLRGVGYRFREEFA